MVINVRVKIWFGMNPEMGLIELKKPIWVSHESWIGLGLNGSVWEIGLGLKVGFF